MQVINSRPNISLANSSASFQAVLQDIVDNITIESNFGVTHTHYQPLELTEESVGRFQKLPQALQDKYLTLQLCNYLAGIYFTHSLQTILSADQKTGNSTEPQLEENTTLAGVDVVFFERLHSNNNGQGYDDFGWQVIGEGEGNTLIVSKDELTLHIKRDRHLSPETQSTAVGELVSIRLPRNRVDSRNYIAIGNAGSHEREDANSDQQNVGIYFNFNAEGAVRFMAGLTEKLNELSIPFSFKVPYNPWDYKRCDSGKLYFHQQDYQAVKSVLQPIYLANRDLFNSKYPFLTKILAPGIALAEEPNLNSPEAESFSKNRCQMIADGLIKSWKNGEQLKDSKMNQILQQFD
ncbi:MAG: T3SS effector HopA1 family protein, partial [Cyanobacteria bacterium P01_E01_bin.35]